MAHLLVFADTEARGGREAQRALLLAHLCMARWSGALGTNPMEWLQFKQTSRDSVTSCGRRGIDKRGKREEEDEDKEGNKEK